MTFVQQTTPSVTGFAEITGQAATPRSVHLPAREKTVRQILNLLLTRGVAGCWIVQGNTANLPPAPQSPFWVLLEYAEDRDTLFQIAAG
jgi:hypothetical protein